MKIIMYFFAFLHYIGLWVIFEMIMKLLCLTSSVLIAKKQDLAKNKIITFENNKKFTVSQ